MEKKIVVPEGMLKAAMNAIQPSVLIGTQAVALEAALRWLSENPIVPRAEQWRQIWSQDYMTNASAEAAVKWQRIMFDAPEPETPTFIECDTCRVKSGSPTLCAGCLHNREVIEKFTGKMTSGRITLCRHCNKNVADSMMDDTLCGPCYNTRSTWEAPEETRITGCVHGGVLNQPPCAECREAIEAYNRGKKSRPA